VDPVAYPGELEGAYSVGSELDDIDQADLHQSVRLGASRRPVLVAFHLRTRTYIQSTSPTFIPISSEGPVMQSVAFVCPSVCFHSLSSESTVL